MRSHGGARCSEQPLLERRETPTNPAKGGGPNQLRLQEQRMKAAPHHYYCFIFSSFFLRFWVAGAWRLRYASSFCLHFFSCFLHFSFICVGGPGQKGGGQAEGVGGGGGGEAKTRSLFILFSFFLHFIFMFSSFFLHFIFIFLHFFFICVIIFSSFLRCRSPRSSFFLHFVFIFLGGLPQNLHFFFISLPAVLDTGAARGRGTKMQNDEKMMKK